MDDKSASNAFKAFVGELRGILPHLYDPLELRETPFFSLFGLQDCGNPIAALRQLLISAIQALEPGAEIPVHSNTWRIYHILRYRYVEQSGQRTVANNMGLSERQLRRQVRDAEKALADYLWTRYSLQCQAQAVFGAHSLSDESVPTGNADLSDRERELEWVRESFPSEVTNVSALIEAALKTVGPLVQALGVHVAHEMPASLPPVTGQRALLRQAFLNLLTAAVHSVPGGHVRVWAKQETDGIVVCLEAEKDKRSATDVGEAEHLQMARQCIDLFGGELEIRATGEGDLSFVTALLLPVTKPVPVLVVDDNADTLHLFQRYLSGTRYQFVGVDDPEEMLSVAESLLPWVIVLDIMLPEVDGWELLGRLREHPMTRDLPTIVCTVMPQEQLALALGAADFLRKPVSRAVLLSALDRQVNSHRTVSD